METEEDLKWAGSRDRGEFEVVGQRWRQESLRPVGARFLRCVREREREREIICSLSLGFSFYFFYFF